MKLRSARKFLVLAVVLLFSHSQSVFAASITVNATCSLDSAITAANTDTAGGGCPAGSGADTITFTNDITLNLTLPFITSDITIDGGGYIISGDDIGRIFNHTSGHLVVQNATLTKGNAGSGDGGAINGTSDLTLNNVQLTSNTASRGGAIWMSGGTLTINSSVISNNTATATGGGIFARGTTAIENSAIYDNSATTGAGGMNQHHGNLTIKNSTMYGNTGTGAGALMTGLPASATRTLTHVTITNNTSGSGWAALTLAGNTHEIAVENSIIYGNTGGDCHNATLTGSVNSIIGARTSVCTGGTNITTNDPLLPATSSGSPPYFELPAGSPALTAGDDTVCAATPTDQRGASRPATGCDLGAYERDPTTEPTMIPSPTPRPDREDVVLFTIGDLEITYNMVFGDYTYYPGITPTSQARLKLLFGDLLFTGFDTVKSLGTWMASQLTCNAIKFGIDHGLAFVGSKIIANGIGGAIGLQVGALLGGSAGAAAGGPAAPATAPAGATGLGALKAWIGAHAGGRILAAIIAEVVVDEMLAWLQDKLNNEYSGLGTLVDVEADALKKVTIQVLEGADFDNPTDFNLHLGGTALVNSLPSALLTELAEWLFNRVASFIAGREVNLQCRQLPFLTDILAQAGEGITTLEDIGQILILELIDDFRHLIDIARSKAARFKSLATSLLGAESYDIVSLQGIFCAHRDILPLPAIPLSAAADLLTAASGLIPLPSKITNNLDDVSNVELYELLCHPAVPSILTRAICALPLSPATLLGQTVGIVSCPSLVDIIPNKPFSVIISDTYEVAWNGVTGATNYVLGIQFFGSPASEWKQILLSSETTSYQLTTNELSRSAQHFRLRLTAVKDGYASDPLLYPADPNDPTLFAAEPAIVIGENVPLAPQKGRRGSTTVPAVAATPRVSTCENLPANFAVIGYNASTQCNVLDGGGVGKPHLAANFIAALDVWGYLAAGVEVCIQGSGSMWFLDAAHSPRTESTLQAYSWAGMTCTWI